MAKKARGRTLRARPATVNQALRDRHIRHAVFYERLKTGEARRASEFLSDKLLPDLVAELERLRGPLKRSAAPSRRVMRRLVRNVKEQVTAATRAARARARKSLEAVALSEERFAREVVRDTMPIVVELEAVAPTLVRQIVTSTDPSMSILGSTWGELWQNLGRNTSRRVLEQVNIGVAGGESVDQMIRRIRGTRAGGFSDGAIQATRREAETIVRTTTNHIQSQARRMVYEANTDIIKGEKWVSTLDSRTSDICISLDGRVFKVGEGQHPPAHHQCRSIRVPITKSFKELGIDLNEPPPASRAAKNYDSLGRALRGTVPADVTYGGWLRSQPKNVQAAILGPRRAELFRRGKVPVTRFVDSKGRSLNLKQLERLERDIAAGRTPRNPRRRKGEIQSS